MATKLLAFAERFYLKRFMMALPFFVFGILIVDPFLVGSVYYGALTFIFARAFFRTLLYDFPLWLILTYLIKVFKGDVLDHLAVAFIVVNIYYLALYPVEWYFLEGRMYWGTSLDPIYLHGQTLPSFTIPFCLIWIFFTHRYT